MKDEAGIALKDNSMNIAEGAQTLEVRVPASTSNLGAGFDCFGLALELYLTVRAKIAVGSSEACRIRTRGERDSAFLSKSTDNLIFKAMRFAAMRESLRLPHVRLAVHNEIPLGCGLGSSGAAIIAGLTLGAAICGIDLSPDKILRYAVELEGHPDNVVAAFYGGRVTSCITQEKDVLTVKRAWPSIIKVIIVSPHVPVETKRARAALPTMIERADAVYNLQRAALFGAALESERYELLWEAMQDRLHQTHRQHLVPGLAEALATPRLEGLLGLALSGSGPSVIALACDNLGEIGETLANNFQQRGIQTTVRHLAVDEHGMRICKAKTKQRRRTNL